MKQTLTVLLLVFAQLTFAEKLIFTNNNEQVDITGDADINFTTGDISVTTVGEHEIINVSTQPVILGFYPSDYDVAIGASVTIKWSVAFAESCTASVSSGVASWSGNKEPNNGSWDEANVSISQLPATLVLECENAGNLSEVRTFQITEQISGGEPDPTFNSFKINSQSPSVTINPPGTAVVTWNTTNINGCTASASPSVSGWSGAKSANGSENLTILENTTMTMTCDGIERNVNVLFSENSDCSSDVYPQGLNRLDGIYSDFNDQEDFGDSFDVSFMFTLKKTQFGTLSNFSLPEVNSKIRMVFADAPPVYGVMASSTISVSECPGDFTPSAVCVVPVDKLATVHITTKPNDPSTGPYCKIDPTKTYYINYILSPDPYNQAPECLSPDATKCSFFYGYAL